MTADDNKNHEGVWDEETKIPFISLFMRTGEGKLVLSARQGQTLAEAAFKAGQLEGPCKFWYSSGTPRMEGQYKNSLSEGVWREWGPGGTLFVTEYRDEGHSSTSRQVAGITCECDGTNVLYSVGGSFAQADIEKWQPLINRWLKERPADGLQIWLKNPIPFPRLLPLLERLRPAKIDTVLAGNGIKFYMRIPVGIESEQALAKWLGDIELEREAEFPARDSSEAADASTGMHEK